MLQNKKTIEMKKMEDDDINVIMDVRNNQFTLASINNDFFLKYLPKLAILNIGGNQDMDGIDCTKLKNAMPDLLQCWRL